MNNNTITTSGLYFLANPAEYFLACGLYISFCCLQHKCFCYNPSSDVQTMREDANQMLICPHILPMLLQYYCQREIRSFINAWRKSKERLRTLNLTKSLLEMDAEDNDLLLFCTDNEGVRGFLWSCLTFVHCVIENSLRVLVQADRSCCIAP